MKVRVRWVDGRILEIREKGMLLMDLKCQRTSITQAVRMLCWAAPSMEMPFLAVQAFTSESTTVAYKPTGATVDFSKHGGVVMDLDEQSKMQATIYRPETSSRLGTTPSCPWGSPPQLGRDASPTAPLPSRRGGAVEEVVVAVLPPQAVASPGAPRAEATREDGARSRGRRPSRSSTAWGRGHRRTSTQTSKAHVEGRAGSPVPPQACGGRRLAGSLVDEIGHREQAVASALALKRICPGHGQQTGTTGFSQHID